MNVLIAVASKHGATFGIAEAIAGELGRMGFTAEARDVEEIDNLESYEAAVLGSAVYMGRWLGEAADFVASHRAALAAVPVWLFSSGPLGDPLAPVSDPKDLADLIETTRARDHRMFAGRLDPDDLGFGERLVLKIVHAPAGDFRDWEEIRRWAREIGEALKGERADVSGTASASIATQPAAMA